MKNKKSNFNIEITKIIERLSNQKIESLKSLENFKSKIIKKFDSLIDKEYKNKNQAKEVKTQKKYLRKFKITYLKQIINGGPFKFFKYLISAPFIYGMIIPAIPMHLCLEIYHQVCFRIYKIPLVPPSNYFLFDRRNLPHLNFFEKINCFYCSYFNCLVAYMREIAGRTERFWCPIKHSLNLKGTHEHYRMFPEYSDGENLRNEWKKLKQFKEYKNK